MDALNGDRAPGADSSGRSENGRPQDGLKQRPRHAASIANLRPWQKGRSGNPAGRTPEVRQVKELAQQWTVEALNTLVELMTDPAQKGATRIAAAIAILDRGHGKPAVTVDVTARATLIELLARLDAARAGPGAATPATIIDVDDAAAPGPPALVMALSA